MASRKAPRTARDVRVFVADDHPIVRDGLQKLIESQPGFRVAGQAKDGREALALLKTVRADVLLLDLSMPLLSGLDVLRALSRNKVPVRVLVLTATALENDEVLQAVSLGARGVVLKEQTTAVLFDALRCVVGGGRWLGREAVKDLEESLRRCLPAPEKEKDAARFRLTPRELEVVSAVVGGLGNRQIAGQLSLSEQTVKHHLSSVFDKLGVSSRLELALFAIEHRLVVR